MNKHNRTADVRCDSRVTAFELYTAVQRSGMYRGKAVLSVMLHGTLVTVTFV